MKQKELKENFIKYLGEVKWMEEEMLDVLHKEEMKMCEYLNIEMIPILVENINEDSRYYIEENYIAISSRLILDKTEALKCLIHELRHCYQLKCVRNNVENELVDLWSYELKVAHNDINSLVYVELDAYAFTKYIMDKWYKTEVIHPDVLYEEIIILYINKYLLNK